jgi:hypothetical protein
VFFTHDDFDTTQVGSDVSGGPTLDTSQNWFADIDDTIDSVGVGFNFEAIPGKLDIGADYIFSDTRGKTDAQSLSTTGLSQLPQFPDLTTQLHSISINARYHFTEDAELRLRYVHEDQNSRDWALDNVEPDSVERFLLLGEDSPNYTLDVIALSLAYRF